MTSNGFKGELGVHFSKLLLRTVGIRGVESARGRPEGLCVLHGCTNSRVTYSISVSFLTRGLRFDQHRT
jgi:hypothetical protein